MPLSRALAACAASAAVGGFLEQADVAQLARVSRGTAAAAAACWRACAAEAGVTVGPHAAAAPAWLRGRMPTLRLQFSARSGACDAWPGSWPEALERLGVDRLRVASQDARAFGRLPAAGAEHVRLHLAPPGAGACPEWAAAVAAVTTWLRSAAAPRLRSCWVTTTTAGHWPDSVLVGLAAALAQASRLAELRVVHGGQVYTIAHRGCEEAATAAAALVRLPVGEITLDLRGVDAPLLIAALAASSPAPARRRLRLSLCAGVEEAAAALPCLLHGAEDVRLCFHTCFVPDAALLALGRAAQARGTGLEISFVGGRARDAASWSALLGGGVFDYEPRRRAIVAAGARRSPCS
jgi:hypothetical protein